MKIGFFYFLLFAVFTSSSQLPKTFSANDQPNAPDYSNQSSWISLPFRLDGADVVPKKEFWVSDSLKDVDVFYIYPTIYAKGQTWCADIADQKLNDKIDRLPVKYQASLFNSVARIYAPRYRQGIIDCFHDTSSAAKQALDFAYQDVKKAFEYYLKNYNQGRPIIIVSHSQGTLHARRLLSEFFDSPEMKKKLVCAYVVGFGIHSADYQVLKPCSDSKETNCYVTWSSFQHRYIPEKNNLLFGNVCINPISWTCDTMHAAMNTSILYNIDLKKDYYTDVQVRQHYLWVKTKMPFMPFFKVMHILDFNLYWASIKNNVKLRVSEYLKNQSK